MPAVVIVILVAGLAFTVAFVLTRLFIHPESRMHILDHPNERSRHAIPTPRSGGVAIVSGIAVGATIAETLGGLNAIPSEALWLGGLAALIAVVSYWDDRHHLPVGLRLAVHFVAAVSLVVAGEAVSATVLPGITWFAAPVWFAGTLGVLFTVWMINLYNFMDGMDGFAGGMTVIGFGTFALLGGIGGDLWFATLNLIIAAAAGGFLAFNFPPAKIFMGDTGSSTVGFLAASMALWGNASGVVPLWVALLVFSPFIVDATITLLRRTLRGEKVWLAHKTHYYQRLVQAGWGHRRTVLIEYALMAVCAGGALVARIASVPVQWAVITVVLVVYAGFFRMVRVMEIRARVGTGKV